MNASEIASVALGIIAVLMIPGVVALIRGAIKWTRVELRLEQLVMRVEQLVHDKDETHQEMVRQMSKDREATNKRLVWLERYVWGRIGGRERNGDSDAV